jgi:hypothetical protein
MENNKKAGGQIKNIAGQKFGKLLVIEMVDKPEGIKKGTYWLCQCDCGNIKSIPSDYLLDGNTKSCGCLKLEKEDLSGMKFNRWTVIEFSHYGKRRNLYWKCVCDCGTEKTVKGSQLKNGESKSCGCLNKEITHERMFKDLTGFRFERLIVIKIDHTKPKIRGGYEYYWECICDCGNSVICSGKSLKSGERKSCGCLRLERQRKVLLKNGPEPAFKLLMTTYIRGAFKRNLEFELTEDEFKFLTQQKCFYCGEEPYRKKKSGKLCDIYVYNGIDRMDNLKGYVFNNCVSCCFKCNKMKMEMSKEKFIEHVLKIYNNLIKNKENNE